MVFSENPNNVKYKWRWWRSYWKRFEYFLLVLIAYLLMMQSTLNYLSTLWE